MKKLSVMSIFGTRPEAIKMAPLVLELSRREEIESLVCVTAQHRQMLDSVLDFFKITPDFDLNVMQSAQSLEDITSRVLYGLAGVFEKKRPDLVLVHGDTSTTFVGALSAFYHKIPVGHVEAGLRTYDRYSPFPEEMNRNLVGRLAEYHFAPTGGNAENLYKEGIRDKVFITGNTVIDAMSYTAGDGSLSDETLKRVDFQNRRVIALTCHRRENYGQPMEDIFSAIGRLARDYAGDVEFVYPVHLSPQVRETAGRLLGGIPGVHLIDPLDTFEMHRLMAKCYMVMTDSGGLQEEAPALGKPVIVLRRETERPEAIAAGTAILAGVGEEEVYSVARELLDNPAAYEASAKAVNPYGDGRASARIAEAILYGFGLRESRPEDWKL